MLLKFYLLLSNLAVCNYYEDKIGNGTCIDCYIITTLWFNITFRCGAIVLSVVIGTPRPDNKIEQNAISTPFLCPFINNRLNKRYIINPFPWEIEKHKKSHRKKNEENTEFNVHLHPEGGVT